MKGTQGLFGGSLGSTARASVAELFSKRVCSPHSALYVGRSVRFLDSASEYRLFAGASQQFVVSRQWLSVLL